MTTDQQAAAYDDVADQLDQDVRELMTKAVDYQRRAISLRKHAASLREARNPPPCRPDGTQYGRNW